MQTLRIELTSEEELFFMHALEVTEEDFLTLKADQGILVDFLGFPEKVASLLERCSQARKDASNRSAFNRFDLLSPLGASLNNQAALPV